MQQAKQKNDSAHAWAAVTWMQLRQDDLHGKTEYCRDEDSLVWVSIISNACMYAALPQEDKGIGWPTEFLKFLRSIFKNNVLIFKMLRCSDSYGMTQDPMIK